eukprot:jgi/Phyca11/101845/e_gw1.6.1111.1
MQRFIPCLASVRFSPWSWDDFSSFNVHTQQALRQETLYVHTETLNREHTGQLGHHCVSATMALRPTM